MYTEEMLKEFSLNDLDDLMVSKLEELEQLEKNRADINLRILARTELELIQKVIDEKTSRAK